MGFVMSVLFFFFKQKTAYEMRSSDWSSDVCFSALTIDQPRACRQRIGAAIVEQIAVKEVPGDREPGEDVRPIGRTARSQEWRQGKEPIGITRPGRATDGGAAFGADEGEIGGDRKITRLKSSH